MKNTIKVVDMLKLAENHPVYKALQEFFTLKEKEFFDNFTINSKKLNEDINTLKSGLTTNLSSTPQEQAKNLGIRKNELETQYAIQQRKLQYIERLVTNKTYDLIKKEMNKILEPSECSVIIDINACPYIAPGTDFTNEILDHITSLTYDIESITKDVELELEQILTQFNN